MKIVKEIEPKSPFSLTLTSWLLKRSVKNGIDMISDKTYCRVLTLREPVLVKVTQDSRIVVEASGEEAERAVEIVERMLGTHVDLTRFYEISQAHPVLRDMVRRFLGAKPVVFPSLFEAVINAITCQQISLDACLSILTRLTITFGDKVYLDNLTAYGFPRPETLINAKQELRKIGYSERKATYIGEVATKFASGEIQEERLRNASNEDVIELLGELKGIGRWSLDYILLRGLGRLNVFPTGDAGAQNKLRRYFNLSASDTEHVKRSLEPWSEYAGLIYFHLLLASLDEKGVLPH